MEWLKLNLRTLRSPEYIGSEPVARATWLNLLAYCADEENGGVVRDCSKWKDRMWQQLVGVTLEEVQLETDLFTWDGDHLTVWNYPLDTEALVKTRREAGRKGGSQSSESFASSKSEPNPDFASTEQSRAEQKREDHIRAEQRGKSGGCKGLRIDDVEAWIAKQNGAIPDKQRALSLARELIDEMTPKKWTVQGQPVANPMGLLVARLKRDKAYLPKE